jgi:effector-binding domain-containing protein
LNRQRLYFLLAFLLPTLGVLWWWGLFTSATVEVAARGPYRYAYLEAQGAYTKLVTKRGEVELALRQQGIAPQRSITIIYDDPRTTDREKRTARTGFFLEQDVMTKPPLATDTIPARRVVLARIKAHPVFAYGKAYGALLEYAAQHKMALRMPTLEIYDASVLTVEMPLEDHP